MPIWRRWLLRLIRAVATLILLGLLIATFAYWETQWPPTIRRAEVALADWPANEPPVTVLLVSDTHVAGPDMPPERLARLVDNLNRLKPDLVLLAGDYISLKRWATHHYSVADSIAPLTRFRARLGIVAVLGNHDHSAGSLSFRQAFATSNIMLLRNDAVKRGPLIIGGLDDSFSYHARIDQLGRAMAKSGAGPRLLLTHTPNPARRLPFKVDAVLAGHTHCGQINLPIIGMPAQDGHAFQWLPCGQIDLNGTPLFVGAGLGTSIIPLRLGAPPDAWLIRFGPKHR